MKPFLYERLTRALLIEAGSGYYTSGQRFLSFRQVVRRFRLAKLTVRRALAQLVAEGVLVTKPRSGHILAPGGAVRARALLAVGRVPPAAPVPAVYLAAGLTAQRRIGMRIAVVGRGHLTQEQLRLAAFRADPRKDPATFGMLWPWVSFLREVNRRLCEIEFFEDDGTARTRQQILAAICGGGISGVAVFLYGEKFTDQAFFKGVRGARIPSVTVLSDCQGAADSSVDFNHTGAGGEAMRLLVGHGHRHIIAVLPLDRIDRFEQRLEGARVFLRRAGMDDTVRLRVGRVDPEGRPAPGLVRMLAARKSRPTALFLTGIGHFAGIVRLLDTLGLAVPRDISVIGCGVPGLLDRNLRWLDLLFMDFGKTGRVAAENLFNLIARQPVPRAVLVDMPHRPGKSIAPWKRAAETIVEKSI